MIYECRHEMEVEEVEELLQSKKLWIGMLFPMLDSRTDNENTVRSNQQHQIL
jgi:hypothetical protein